MTYKNPNLPIEERVADLLAQMSVDEKLNQMLLNPSLDKVYEKLKKNDCAGVYGNGFMPDSVDNEKVVFIQNYLLHNTRLGIPMLIHGEGLHGVINADATVFPQSLTISSAFNERLLEEIAEVIGAEASALGLKQLYAPDLDLARDPRWGRTEETYGEDPYLTAKLGTTYVRGIQKNAVAATLKHYVAHGCPEGGLNLAPAHLGERELRETMLKPFAAAVREGAMSVMPAYSELDGVPVHASQFLLRDVLRKELGFGGTVVSDYTAVKMLHTLHRTAATPLEAGLQALAAGIDVEAPDPFGYGAAFRQEAKDGKIDLRRIDEATGRVLALKFKLGLFENSFPSRNHKAIIRTPSALELSLEAARQSAVLLKNNSILPFRSIRTVALTGPNADTPQLGDYTSYPDATDRSVTVRRALEERLGTENVLFAEGCHIASPSEDFVQAQENAKRADAVVVVLGDNSMFSGGIGWGDENGTSAVTSGEGFDVNDLNLPACQMRLLRAMRAYRKPLVLLLATGRPYCIGEACEAADAVMQIGYLGEAGGRAVAELLFGDCCPSGRLTVSVPRSTGHLPCYYNYKSSARGYYRSPGTPERPGHDYVFSDPAPLFPFGFGLSYTAFCYRDLKIDISGETITVGVTVENTGNCDALHSVLVFTRTHYCPVTQPVRQLRAFRKISLAAKESKEIHFELNITDFTYIDFEMNEKICFGKHTVMIEDLQAEFELAE